MNTPPRDIGKRLETLAARWAHDADIRRVALPVDPQVVRRRLRALEGYLKALRDLRRLGREAFQTDKAVQAQVERNAQLLAQVCADMALHVLAGTGAAAPAGQ